MSLARDFLHKTLGPSDPINFLPVYPHSSAPGHNLNINVNSELDDGDAVYNASVLFKPFPFTAHYPVPLYPPNENSRSVLNGLDPCLSLVKEKKAWEYKKKVLLKSCNKSMVEDICNDNESIKEKEVKIHPNVATLTAHMENDPDPHFDAPYNWHFNGGNIEIISFNEKKYLIRPNGCKGEILFSPLILEHNQWMPHYEPENELKFKLTTPYAPYQVDTVDNMALIREKTSISQLRIKENDDKIVVEELCNIAASDRNPFICASINKDNVDEFCTLTPYELVLWNASLNSPMSKLNLNLETDNSIDSWGYVYYMESDKIFYANRRAVHLFDLRINNTKSNLTWPINNLVDVCEEINSCNLGSKGINFIATNHHLLSLDIRQGWLQRWTHGITSSPAIIKILKRTTQNFIFLGSQRSDNVVLIQNDCDDGFSDISRFHPYSLPSLRESLHLARFNGLCLDHLISSRFTMSLTGLCCIEDRYINVIRCTSIGDIFWQKLRSSDNESCHVSTTLSDDDLKKFEEFESQCEEAYIHANNYCRVTSVKRTEDLINYIYTSTCPNDESTNKTLLNKTKILPKCKQLKNCRDFLAPVLLEPWDIDDLEDGSDEKETEESTCQVQDVDSSSEEEFAIESAVSNWLNTHTKEMKTFTEYSLDDEGNDLKVNILSTDKEEKTVVVAEQLLAKQELNDIDDITEEKESKEIKLSKIQKSNIEQKPKPSANKKYVSGF